MYAKLWDVKSVNPGSMAFAAILVCVHFVVNFYSRGVQSKYINSEDAGKEFAMSGAVTKINYYKDFFTLRDLAQSRWNYKSFKEVVAWWNQVIFGDSDDEDDTQFPQSRGDYEELLDEIEEDEEEPEEEDEDEGA